MDRKQGPLQIYCIQETDFAVQLLDFAKKEIVLGPALPKLVQVLATLSNLFFNLLHFHEIYLKLSISFQ